MRTKTRLKPGLVSTGLNRLSEFRSHTPVSIGAFVTLATLVIKEMAYEDSLLAAILSPCCGYSKYAHHSTGLICQMREPREAAWHILQRRTFFLAVTLQGRLQIWMKPRNHTFLDEAFLHFLQLL